MGKTLDAQLFRLNNDLFDALGLAESGRLFQLALRERAGLGRHGDGFVPERIVGDFEQKGGIHPAGKRHRYAAQFLQVVFQCL